MSFKSINLIGLILIIATSFAMLEGAGVFGTVDVNTGTNISIYTQTDADVAAIASVAVADIDVDKYATKDTDADTSGKIGEVAETPPPESIKWYSYTGGKHQSNNSGKPIMVDVYADWCGWCKTLDEETYSDARVIELAADSFISVKINGDNDYDFAMKYGIRNYPTILFVDSEGNEIHRVIGFRNADRFLDDMKTAMQKA